MMKERARPGFRAMMEGAERMREALDWERTAARTE